MCYTREPPDDTGSPGPDSDPRGNGDGRNPIIHSRVKQVGDIRFIEHTFFDLNTQEVICVVIELR